jgi:nucleoside-diphosphate-sugar epimerase
VIDDARILLTGATGSFGRHLAAELQQRGCRLTLLVRARSQREAEERARAAVGHLEPGRTRVFRADLEDGRLGLESKDRRRLSASVDVIVHAAAATSFSQELAAARRANVGATRNVLAFAAGIPGLSRLAYVSTAFVAGRSTGRILETLTEHDLGWINGYQQSKYEAERLVLQRGDAFPVVVLRPSIVLDPPRPGPISRRSGFRFALELVRRGLLPALPGSPGTLVDLVTETDAAQAAVSLLGLSEAGGVYHVAGGQRAPTLGQIVNPIRRVRYLEEERFRWELRRWQHATPRLADVYAELLSFIPELAYPKVFDTTRVEAALGRPVPQDDPLTVLRPTPRAAAMAAGR